MTGKNESSTKFSVFNSVCKNTSRLIVWAVYLCIYVFLFLSFEKKHSKATGSLETQSFMVVIKAIRYGITCLKEEGRGRRGRGGGRRR